MSTAEQKFTPIKLICLFGFLVLMVLVAQDIRTGMPLLLKPKNDANSYKQQIYTHALDPYHNYDSSVKFNKGGIKIIALKRSLWQEKIKHKFFRKSHLEPHDYLAIKINAYNLNALVQTFLQQEQKRYLLLFWRQVDAPKTPFTGDLNKLLAIAWYDENHQIKQDVIYNCAVFDFVSDDACMDAQKIEQIFNYFALSNNS